MMRKHGVITCWKNYDLNQPAKKRLGRPPKPTPALKRLKAVADSSEGGGGVAARPRLAQVNEMDPQAAGSSTDTGRRVCELRGDHYYY